MLGVLALAFLLRCMLDPWDLVYYHLPLVVALAAWEARRGRDLPVLSVVVTAACWLTFVVYDARTGHGPVPRLPGVDAFRWRRASPSRSCVRPRRSAHAPARAVPAPAPA